MDASNISSWNPQTNTFACAKILHDDYVIHFLAIRLDHFVCMYVATYTVWHKCLTGKNFDEFDKTKLHCQNFPCQYFALGIK